MADDVWNLMAISRAHCSHKHRWLHGSISTDGTSSRQIAHTSGLDDDERESVPVVDVDEVDVELPCCKPSAPSSFLLPTRRCSRWMARMAIAARRKVARASKRPFSSLEIFMAASTHARNW